MTNQKRNFPPIRALERGLAVLQDLSLYKGAYPQQIARRLDLPRPTVVRILETLEDQGFVERSPSDSSWHPTLYARSLSDGYNEEAWVRECAAPEIELLGKQILWPVDLHTLQNDMMLVRESTHRTSPFSIQHGLVGTRLPILQTSSGRTFLAFCPAEEREAILDRLFAQEESASNSACDRRYIGQLIAKTREQGYGLRCGELIRATNSFSVPVHAKGRVQAVVTVVWFVSALPVSEGLKRFLEPARECANRIARKCEDFPDLTMRYVRHGNSQNG